MAVDLKYGRIFRQTDVEAILKKAGAARELDSIVDALHESGHDFHFGADEPVVVFRSQDKLLPKVPSSDALAPQG